MIPLRNLPRAMRKAVKQPLYALRALRQRLGGYLSYRLRDGKSSLPETISLFLTYRCNLKCKMCGQWGMTGSFRDYSSDTLSQSLSLDEIEAVIDDVSRFKPNITLFGGEPLLYKGWQDIVSIVKAEGMRCNIITNGTLVERFVTELVSLKVDEIIFSLDGPREIHDSMRGIPGTFDSAFAGFMALAEEKRSHGSSHPMLNISSTVFEENYTRLSEVVDVAEELSAASVTFHHLIFLSREQYDHHNEVFSGKFGVTCEDWGGFVRESLPEIDPEALLKQMSDLKSRRSPVNVSFYPNLTDAEIRRYYTNFEFSPTSYKCRCISPWMVAYIFPDGSVRPCQSLNFTAGNVKQDSFAKIWNCEPYRNFRRTVKEERTFPVCTKCTELYRF